MNTVEEMEVDQPVMNANDKEATEFEINATKVLANRHCICIFIKTHDYFKKVNFEDILFLEASGSYCNIYLKEHVKLTVPHSLSETAGHLSKGPFVRVHRSFVVNLGQVDGYIGNVFYIGEHTVPIGRMYRKEILAGLNILGSV